MVVWGPKSTGKSLGIQEMAMLWKKQGRIVTMKLDVTNARRAGDLDTYLQFLFGTTDTALGMDFQGLIEFLELLTVQRPLIAPIMILRELHYLNKIGGSSLLSEILRTLESRKQGRSLVGVIIETSSEYTWVEAENFLHSRESFRSHLVWYMDKAQTQKELVDILNVFTNDQFELVWEAAKGHPGSLEMIFQDIRAGTPLDQAIDNARRDTSSLMLSGLVRAPNRTQCKEELERLKRNDWAIVDEEFPLENPALRFMIEKNILFVLARRHVVPQHEMMRWAIDEYVSNFPVTP